MRSTWMVLSLLPLIVSDGCAKHVAPPGPPAPALVEADRCTTVTNHVVDLVASSGKLGFAERMMLNAGRGQLAEACRKQGGMSATQASCFLDIQTMEQMNSIDACPALVAHPLPWLNMSSEHATKGQSSRSSTSASTAPSPK